MNDLMYLTDDAIRAALTPAAGVRAPSDLAAGIRSAVATTPQVRRGVLDLRLTLPIAPVVRVGLVALLVLALVGALLLVGSRRHDPLMQPAVLTYHGSPDRTGVMPGPAPAGRLRIEWSQSLPGGVGESSPVVLAGVVYVADQAGYVSAFAEQDGTPRWQVSVGAPVNSGLSISNGLLIFGDDDGIVHALDIADAGRERWKISTLNPVHSVVAVEGGVGFMGGHIRLYAFDTATGSFAWPAATTPGEVSRAVAVASGLVFAGSGGAGPSDPGSIAAYDAATGRSVWRQLLEPGNTSTPSVSGGRVFVTGGLDTSDTPPHYLYAFDAATGTPSWPAPFHAPSGDVMRIGAVADGLVFAEGTDGMLYVLDAATGVLRGDPLPIGSTSTPDGGYVGGVFYAASDDRRIHAIDAATSTELWSFAVTGAPGAPAIVDGRIFVSTSLNRLESIAGDNTPAATGVGP